MVRGAFDITSRDGYTHDLNLGRDVDDLNYKSFRGSVLFQPTSNFSNLTIYQHQESDQEGPGNRPVYADDTLATKIATNAGLIGILQGYKLGAFPAVVNNALAQSGITPGMLPEITDPNFAVETGNRILAAYNGYIDQINALGPRNTFSGNLAFGPQGGNFDRSKMDIIVNRTTFDLSDDLTLKNIFGYYNRKAQTGGDLDGTPFMLLDVGSGNIDSLWGTRKSISNELQLSGKAIDGRLNWTIGFYADRQTTPFVASNNTALFAFAQSSKSLIRNYSA